MQTYTHLAIGGLIAVTLFPNDPLSEGMCLLGSCASDVPAMFIMFKDVVNKARPFSRLSALNKRTIEICHSLPLSLIFIVQALVMGNSFKRAFSLGFLSHILIDITTHTGKGEYAETDPSYLWPLPWKLRIAIWDYRFGTGILMPKPFEALILVCTVFGIFVISMLHVKG